MFNQSSLALGIALFCCVGLAHGKVVGSGKMASEARSAAGAHGVDLACIGELSVVQGDAESLVVEAEDNVVPLIKSEVNKDGILVIRFENNTDVRPTKGVSYKLTVPHLDNLLLSGSGNIAADRLAADKVQIHLSGSGDIRVASVETGDLAVKLAGSGHVSLAGGSAGHQSISLPGSGAFAGNTLKSAAAEVTINGSGEAKVHADETLDIRIGGSGEVLYTGDPKVTQRISGSGAVHRM